MGRAFHEIAQRRYHQAAECYKESTVESILLDTNTDTALALQLLTRWASIHLHLIFVS